MAISPEGETSAAGLWDISTYDCFLDRQVAISSYVVCPVCRQDMFQMSLTSIERRIAVLSRNPRLNPDFCFLIGFADREKITMAICSSVWASGIRRSASSFPRLRLICRTLPALQSLFQMYLLKFLAGRYKNVVTWRFVGPPRLLWLFATTGPISFKLQGVRR